MNFLPISNKMPLNAIQDAMSAFAQGRLDLFDPLGGDNACQIRAAKICDLFNRFMEDFAFACQIRQMQENPSIQALDDDLSFLVNSYFLQHNKKKDGSGSEKIDPKMGAKEFGISASKALEICKYAQASLSKFSVQYVQELAELNKPRLLPLVSENCVLKDKQGRTMAPCFFAMKILMKTIPCIVLKCKEFAEDMEVRQTSIVYQAFGGKKKFHRIIEKEQIPEDMEKIPVVVMEGIAKREFNAPDILDQIASIPLKTLVLANAAAHSQYAQEYRDATIPFPSGLERQEEKMQKMKETAEQLGCSLANPLLFCIDHIYASTLKEAIR